MNSKFTKYPVMAASNSSYMNKLKQILIANGEKSEKGNYVLRNVNLAQYVPTDNRIIYMNPMWGYPRYVYDFRTDSFYKQNVEGRKANLTRATLVKNVLNEIKPGSKLNDYDESGHLVVNSASSIASQIPAKYKKYYRQLTHQICEEVGYDDEYFDYVPDGLDAYRFTFICNLVGKTEEIDEGLADYALSPATLVEDEKGETHVITTSAGECFDVDLNEVRSIFSNSQY